MSTSKFDFTIQDFNQQRISINVENGQCEIDGGYEGMSKLMLLEAKNFISDDFLIRQLYYPFRLWQGKIRKEVIPVFMTYSNDVFSFFKFAFKDVKNYNSLQLIEQKNYIIASEAIDIEDIEKILNTVQIIKEPDVPFPQADKFERVVDLLGLLMDKGTLEKDAITSEYDFHDRQADYYANAGIYLGLIERADKGVFQLTPQGTTIMQMPYKKKYLALVKAVLSHEVFYQSMKLYFKTFAPVKPEQVVKIMQGCSIHNVRTDYTRFRRSQTVIKRLEWILDLPE